MTQCVVRSRVLDAIVTAQADDVVLRNDTELAKIYAATDMTNDGDKPVCCT